MSEVTSGGVLNSFNRTTGAAAAFLVFLAEFFHRISVSPAYTGTVPVVFKKIVPAFKRFYIQTPGGLLLCRQQETVIVTDSLLNLFWC